MKCQEPNQNQQDFLLATDACRLKKQLRCVAWVKVLGLIYEGLHRFHTKSLQMPKRQTWHCWPLLFSGGFLFLFFTTNRKEKTKNLDNFKLKVYIYKCLSYISCKGGVEVEILISEVNEITQKYIYFVVFL